LSLDPDGWRSVLCNEPFFLTPEAVGKLNDREAWEWYVRPAVERAKRLEAARDGVDPDATPYEPQTVEEQLQYLRDIGVVGVPDVPPTKE
jgi:hypothetical protein